MQLINGISSDLQKLLKYFNGKTCFVFCKTPAVLPTRAALYLNVQNYQQSNQHYQLEPHFF